MMKDPYERYEEKPFPGSSHTWAFTQLADCDPSCSVLDVGPGSGIIGKFLRDNGLTDLSAIEIDAATRDQLTGLYPVIVGDLTELPENKQYDLVVLLDVLEHMSDPYGFLDALQPRLAPGARLLISVPNITHLAIRIMMLFGYFEYMDRGPLDRTHLQFFSRRRFLSLLNHLEGSMATASSGTIEPLELMLPPLFWDNPVFGTLSRFRIWLMNLLPSLLAYQHVGVVQLPQAGKDRS